MKLLIKYIIIICFLCLYCVNGLAQYDRDAFMFRGRAALAEGKYASAIEQFNILEKIDSTDYLSSFYRGVAKFNLGDVRGAQKDFNKAVRLNPVFTAGFHYRGITNSRFGDYDKALEDIQKAIQLRPNYEGLYFSRGVTYFLSGQFKQAVEDFDKYIRKEPKDPSAYLNRGASYLFMGDTLKAIKDYDKAIELDHFEPEAFVRRARVYAAKQDYKKALDDLNAAIKIDSINTFAYFNRAIIYADINSLNEAMSDLNKVLDLDHGNALALYNRSLLSARVGNYEDALNDIDRVININPKNVLAYFNRASYFINLNKLEQALDDYTKAINLYPDFAKAYMNRSIIENKLGMTKQSKQDYNIAVQKIKEYQSKSNDNVNSFADTTKKYSALLALDADFAKKDFDNELLQHRDIDIRLKPLYRFVIVNSKGFESNNLSNDYRNLLISKFINESPVSLNICNIDTVVLNKGIETKIIDNYNWKFDNEHDFVKGLFYLQDKQYNMALNSYNEAINKEVDNKYQKLYKAFYYMNRAVLHADMIDFISSIENNVQMLSMDEKGTARAKVKDQVSTTYDYSQAIEDTQKAIEIVGDIPYMYFNLGNLYCLSLKLVEALESYSNAIKFYPYMGNAYFNRGLVLIYLKDKEKGCIDLSRAGELGVEEAYSVIKKYCKQDNE